MEGESPLLKEGGNAAKPLLTRFCVAKSVISPSKPPSLTENFPTEPRCYRSENLFRFLWRRGFCGKVFLLLGETRISCRMRLSHLFCERGAIRWDALHECRDSACRRPFGVRLRGSSSFYRLISDICAAPLRMTQWADCCVDDTILVCQIIHRERPVCRSARPTTNYLPFISGSGEKRQLCQSRLTGLTSEQPEFAARQTAAPKISTT